MSRKSRANAQRQAQLAAQLELDYEKSRIRGSFEWWQYAHLDIESLDAAMMQFESARADLDRAVIAAARRGVSWAVIGRILGMTRQGARQRYASRVGE